jgi:hypothetical protein
MFYCIFRRESAAVNSNLQVRRLREEASEAGSKYTEVVKVCRDHILNMYIIKGNTKLPPFERKYKVTSLIYS